MSTSLTQATSVAFPPTFRITKSIKKLIISRFGFPELTQLVFPAIKRYATILKFLYLFSFWIIERATYSRLVINRHLTPARTTPHHRHHFPFRWAVLTRFLQTTHVVHLRAPGHVKPVRRAVIFDQLRLSDAGRRRPARGVDRHGLLAGALDDQRRHAECGQVGTEVGLAERLRTGEGRLEPGLHRDIRRPVEHLVADRARDVADTEELLEEGVAQEMRAIVFQPLRDLIEHRLFGAIGIVRGLGHIGYDRGDQAGGDHALAIVPAHVTRDLAAAHRKADDGRFLRARRLQHIGQIVGERVIVIARPGLSRASETAPVISDGTETGLRQRHHLRVPHIGRQRPAVQQNDGTPFAPVLDVDIGTWEREGYQVRGAALSGIAAANLEGGSGIASRTIASLEHAWGQGREQLGPRDVLVIDEAGMIGSRQMERGLSEAERAGAKVVLVGDPEQLQAIEAGAAFRSLAERHGAAEITEIRRQHEDWQKDATRALATGRTGEALHAYERQGMVRAADTREAARVELMNGWESDRQADPDKSRIILTHTNAEVQELNSEAPSRMRAAGELGEEVGLSVERGRRDFATGDRIMFFRNDRGLGVKNGSLGTLERVSAEGMAVKMDDGRKVAFDLKDYAHVDHGYAATFHKSQGVTVDQAHVLATPGMDRHSAYVGLSRHRDSVQLHYGRDDFTDQRQLTRTLSRDRGKDMAGGSTAPPHGSGPAPGSPPRTARRLPGTRRRGRRWGVNMISASSHAKIRSPRTSPVTSRDPHPPTRAREPPPPAHDRR